MALVDSACLSSPGQRLPSRRPIDQRWDRSRGLVFSNSQRNVLRDFRWSCGDGIAFAETPGLNRGYPTRSPFPKHREEDLVDSPHKISTQNVGQNDKLREVLENERKAHRDTKAEKTQEILGLKDIEEQLVAHTRDLTNQLERKDRELSDLLARKKEELARQLVQKDRELSSLLVRKENQWKTVEDDLRSKLSTAQQDAKAAADQEVAQLKEVANQQEREAAALKQAAVDVADANQSRYSAEMDKMSRETFDEVQDHKNKLESAVTTRFLEEVRSIREAGLHREKFERSDYAAYREQWDQVDASTQALAKLLHISSNGLLAGAYFLGERTDLGFKGAQVHRWFPHIYPLLNRQLQELYNSSCQDALQAALSVRNLRLDLSSVLNDVLKLGHVSRSLTRHLNLSEKPSSYDTSLYANHTLYEAPLQEMYVDINKKLDGITRQIGSVGGQSEEQSLQQRVELLRIQRSAAYRVRRVLHCFKELEALRATLQDSLHEKELFVATEESRDAIIEASRIWYQYTSVNPVTSKESQISGEEQEEARQAFLQKRSEGQEATGELESLVRQRQLLQMHLGREESDKGQFDDDIKKRITRAEVSLNQALSEIVGRRATRAARITSSTHAYKPALSSAPVVAQSNVTRKARLHELESELGRLKEESRSINLASGRAEQIQQSVSVAKRQLNEYHLWQTKDAKARHLRQSPQNHAKIQGLDRYIAKLQACLAANDDVGGSKAIAETLEKQKATSRTQLPRRKRRGAVRAASVKLDEKTQTSDESTFSGRGNRVGESVLTIKPTAVQKAPHDFWPATWRSFQSATARTGETPERSSPISSSSVIDSFTDAAMLPQTPRFYSLHSIAHASCSDDHVSWPQGIDSSDSSSNESDSFGIGNDSNHDTGPVQDSEATFSASGSSQSSYEPSDSKTSPSQESMMSPDGTAEGTQESQSVDVSASDTQLTYQISAEDYRNAVLASRNTNAAFWSHKLYKGSNGKPPTVHYCATFEQAEKNAQDFLAEPVLGFDIEWEMYATPGKSSIKQCVSLIQIASESRVGLFHIAVFKGETPDLLVPPSLRTILESPNHAKAGVNVSGDATRLEKCLDVKMTGLFELSHLYKVVMFSEHSPEQVNRKPFKLADQVQNLLLLPMKKDETRTSHWSKKLDMPQTEYAASDAYAGFRLYHALETRRKKMIPTPPRPAFYEEHKPLQLGDGTFVVARTYAPKRKAEALDDSGKAVEQDEDECEEYFDAVESLDTYQLNSSQESSQSAGVKAPGFGVVYTSLPTQGPSVDPENAGKEQAAHPTTATARDEAAAYTTTTTALSDESGRTQAKNSNQRLPPPASQELNRADLWVTTWRASLPTEYKLKCRTNELRAWHLWHEQGFDCKQVAAFLRVPPLSINTVASYLMQAVKEENLAYDVERAKELLGIIPKSVHGRYQKILDRVSQ